MLLNSRLFLLFATLAPAAALRLGLGARGWVALNSDEAALGLLVDDILWHGAHPVFLYGQHYLGALQAYLTVPFFALLGPTNFALHTSTAVVILLFLLALYAYTSGIYSPAVAWCTLALLALGPPVGLFHEQEAANHTQNLLLFGALLLWLVFLRLSRPQGRSVRMALDVGIGLAAGLGLWGTPLMLVFILAAGLALGTEALRQTWAAPNHQTLWSLSGHCVLLGFGAAVGLAPWIAGTIASQGVIFREFQEITGLAGAAHPSSAMREVGFLSTLGQRLAGTFLMSLPQALGSSVVCADCPAVFLSQHALLSPEMLGGALRSAPFSLMAVALWTFAVISLARQIKPVFWPAKGGTVDASLQQQQAHARARWWGQAMLVVGGALTVLAYAATRASYEAPYATTRYLVGLYLCMPLVVAPLWHSSQRFWRRPGGRTSPLAGRMRLCLSGLLATVLLMTLFSLYIAGAVNLFQQTTNAQLYGVPAGKRDMQLLAFLRQHQITHFYSTYWVCYRLMFEEQEQVTCAVMHDANVFLPGFNRITSSVARVAAVPHPAYVFDTTLPIDQKLYRQVADCLKQHDTRFVGYREASVAAYLVYYYSKQSG